MSKWIDFNKLKTPSDRKTDVYQVVTKDGTSLLGTVSWYAPWRCYSFQPNSNCVFEHQCLKDIAAFLDKLMYERKVSKQGGTFILDILKDKANGRT